MGQPDTQSTQNPNDPQNTDTQQLPGQQSDQADGSRNPQQPGRGSGDGTAQAPAREGDGEPSRSQMHDEDKSWRPQDDSNESAEHRKDPHADQRQREGGF